MGQIIEGNVIKHIGAFYPQAQASPDYDNDWKVCAEDLNLVLASHKNFSHPNETFIGKVVTQFFNNYGDGRVALCWDVNYAFQEAGYGQSGTRTRLESAMGEVAEAIDGMDGQIDKDQYWQDINWGGFVADEPIASYDEDQDSDDAIEEKCNALQDAFENVAGQYDWGEPVLRKMVALHRANNCPAWEEGSGTTEDGGDDEFEERAPVWAGFGAKYRVNTWGMDPYIYRVTAPTPWQDDDLKITSDRDYFYQYLVNCFETKDTHFLAMIGKAFLSHDREECEEHGWLTETQTKYYWNDIQGPSEIFEGDWEDQFAALFWWAYKTDVIDNDPLVEAGYDESSDVKDWIVDVSYANWCA
jgi:hypothetical protein